MADHYPSIDYFQPLIGSLIPLHNRPPYIPVSKFSELTLLGTRADYPSGALMEYLLT